MNPDLRQLIALHAINALEPEEASQVGAALAADAGLANQFLELLESVHRLSACTPQVEPSPEVELQLMASIGAGRFERFAARVAAMYDFGLERAREVLGRIERTSAWKDPLPHVDLIHFSGGASCAQADCGVVRIRAGGVFPVHTHLGEEMSVIVAGVVRDSDGSVYGPGDEIRKPSGTSHKLTAEGSDDVILFARAFNGIQLARVRQP